jgi:release factor glutamine methyltransferase
MSSYLKQRLSVWIVKAIQLFGPRKVTVLGIPIEISRNVFSPKFYCSSTFMAKNIRILPGEVILDMGSGSGIQAIVAAQTALKVVAIDINPEAVQYAKRNITANKLDKKINVIQGDLFSSLSSNEKFDVIIFTPPYLDGIPRTYLEHALFDPEKDLARRFFSEAGNYLKHGGYVQMLYSSLADHEKVLKIADALGWIYKKTAEYKIATECFYIYKLTYFR